MQFGYHAAQLPGGYRAAQLPGGYHAAQLSGGYTMWMSISTKETMNRSKWSPYV